MIDLYGIAKKTVGSGKYLSINDAIKTYPEGITINGISSRVGKDKKEYYTLTFAESSEEYIPASSGDLFKMVSAWLEKGSVEEVSEALAVENFRIRIEKIKQKNGNPYVKVYPIGIVKVAVDENGKQIDTETGEVIPTKDGLFEESVPF